MTLARSTPAWAMARSDTRPILEDLLGSGD